MLVISNSVLPSTSKSPFASILPVNVEIPVTLRVSLMLVVSSSVLPSTSRSPFASILPVTFKATPTERVDPLNVRFASSSSSPPDPAMTTRLSVRSSTIRVFAVTPPLASTRPVNVEIPDTLREVAVVTPAGN